MASGDRTYDAAQPLAVITERDKAAIARRMGTFASVLDQDAGMHPASLANFIAAVIVAHKSKHKFSAVVRVLNYFTSSMFGTLMNVILIAAIFVTISDVGWLVVRSVLYALAAFGLVVVFVQITGRRVLMAHKNHSVHHALGSHAIMSALAFALHPLAVALVFEAHAAWSTLSIPSWGLVLLGMKAGEILEKGLAFIVAAESMVAEAIHTAVAHARATLRATSHGQRDVSTQVATIGNVEPADAAVPGADSDADDALRDDTAPVAARARVSRARTSHMF